MATGRTNAGGMSTADATATAEDILEGKTAYTGSGKVEGKMPKFVADDESFVLDGELIYGAYRNSYYGDELVGVSLFPKSSGYTVKTEGKYMPFDLWVTGSADTSSVNIIPSDVRKYTSSGDDALFVDAKGESQNGTIEDFDPSENLSSEFSYEDHSSDGYLNLFPSSGWSRINCTGKYMPYFLDVFVPSSSTTVVEPSYNWTEHKDSGTKGSNGNVYPIEYLTWDSSFSGANLLLFYAKIPGDYSFYNGATVITKALFMKESNGYTLVYFELASYSSSRGYPSLSSYTGTFYSEPLVSISSTDSTTTLTADTTQGIYLMNNLLGWGVIAWGRTS